MFEVSSILALDSENAPALNQLGQTLLLTHPSERLGVHSAFNQPLRGPKIKSKSEFRGRTLRPQATFSCDLIVVKALVGVG